MAVDVKKDGTFNKVHSAWWDGSESPAELAAAIEAQLISNANLEECEIVLEVDSGNWYTYVDAREAAKRGWYDSNGAKKA